VTRPGGGAVMARRLWWRGRRAGGRQRVAGRVRTRARQEGGQRRACRRALEAGHRARGQAAAQRGSGRMRGVPEHLRAQRGRVSEGEREEREKGSGEREKKVHCLT